MEQNFNLITCWWVGLFYLPVGWLAWKDPALGSTGSMVGLMATSKRTDNKRHLPRLLLPVPLSLQLATAYPHSRGEPPKLAGKSSSVSCGVTAPFHWFWWAQDFVYALQEWSICSPQSCGRSVIKHWWSLKSYYLGIPNPFAGSPGWEAWREAQNLYNIGRHSLVLLFSNLWATHPVGMGFGFTVTVPLLLSCCGFFFVFGLGVSFWGGGEVGSSVLL